MASGATQHDSAGASASRSSKLVAYEHFIEAQLRKTGNGVKAVDLIGALMTMAVAALFYFFAVALLDHWLVPGGLGHAGRFFFFVVLLAAGGFYTARNVVPLLMGRINPLYSAHTIEQNSPTLKNSLLNFLLFRRDRESLPEPVYQALEVQAAKRLSSVQVDAAIDRSKIVRLGYVLLGVVIAYALYMVISPKNPLATAGRVLLPWSDIQAPSRVTIQHVEPGNAVGSQAVLRGGRLTVSAEVLGIEPDEPVTLYYTSTDAQAVDRAVTMFVPEGALRYECELPEPDAGLYVDFDYRIEAGDAISTSYHVEVVARPQIVVESIDYAYPKYTHLTDRTVSDQGDLKALEGTRVTIRARANYPIGSAWVDFDADGRSDLAMQTEGDEATVSFFLKLTEDRRSAWHSSYSLRFSNHQSRRNREPVQYRIEVTPDLKPEITILAPKEEEVEVPLDGEVIIETQALDPDFALRQIALNGAISGKQVFHNRLLDAEHQGQWNHKYRLVPRRAGFKAGDLVEVWAEAHDNKTPQPNLARTSRSRRLRIVGPTESTSSEKPQPKRQDTPDTAPKDPSAKDQEAPKSEKPEDGQEGENGSESGEEGKSGEGEQSGGSEGQSGKQDQGSESKQDEGEGQQSGGSEGKPDGEGQEEGEGSEEGVANDGSDDGGAFQEILKKLQEEQGQGENSSPEQGQQDGSPEGGQENSPSEGSEGSESGQKPQDPEGSEQGSGGQPKKGQPEQSPGGSDPSGKDQPEGGNPDSGQEGNPSAEDGTKSDSGSKGSDEGQQSDKKPDGSEKPSEGDSPGKQPGKQDSASKQSPDGKQAEGEKGGTEGQGAKSKRPGAEPGQKPTGQEAERPDAKGGDGSNEKGNSGAGKKGSDDAGSPNPEPGTTPKNNKKPGEGSEEGGKDKPKSPAHGNKESNSDGSQGGDKSGGGEEGGGQKANRRGTGSAGQNTASDEGGGQAEESGKGDTSDKSGNDVKSDRSTDDPGQKQTGQGSKQQPGSKPSGSESPDSEQTGEGKSSPRKDSTQGKEGQGRPSAGKQGDTRPNEPSGRGETPESEPGGDQADLEYARKATDLVLEHLEHDLEKDQVDKDLLDKLGWSQDDLRKFVQRWKNLKQDSRAQGDQGKTARRELNEALRSLGLRSGNVTRRGTRGSDTQQNLRESHRIPPPPGYAEQLKAYRRGLSETRPAGEND